MKIARRSDPLGSLPPRQDPAPSPATALAHGLLRRGRLPRSRSVATPLHLVLADPAQSPLSSRCHSR